VEPIPFPTGGRPDASQRLRLTSAEWFAAEVQPHEPALRGYLRSAFPSLDTDDLVQESYLKLWRARALGRIASTKAYLFSIARNTARTIFHRQRVFSPVPVSDLPDWRVLADEPSAAETVAAHERFEMISEAIAQLPSRCREVLSLAVLQGCSNAEIATRLGLAEATVRVHLARGIRKCAGFLRERGGSP
jgi:RNA polymerase sigma-70 factor (ECF subfamily)